MNDQPDQPITMTAPDEATVLFRHHEMPALINLVAGKIHQREAQGATSTVILTELAILRAVHQRLVDAAPAWLREALAGGDEEGD